MIRLTRINHVPLVLNSDLIEHVEITPDTVITLTTGAKLMVRESAEEVIERVIAFRRAVQARFQGCPWVIPAPNQTDQQATGCADRREAAPQDGSEDCHN